MNRQFGVAIAASLLVLGAAVFQAKAAPAETAEQASNAATDSSNAHSEKPAAKKRPHMDVAFCIDTTGSMQGEINMVKTKTKEMVAKLGAGKPAPVIRVGLVAYRDHGDAYVTKIYPFSDDIDKVVKDISDLQAQGGGDGPEAVDEGLHAAIKKLKWDDDKHTAKILFLIGDAGPHGYDTDLDWRKDCHDAINSGIQINTMGCRGLEAYPVHQGTDVFKEIAQLADGKYESLSYRQEIVDASGRRETIVHSGGSAYKVSAPASVGWKDAMARGMVKKYDAPSMPVVYGASPSSASGYAESYSSRRASGIAAGGAGMAAAAAPVSRADNNLDALMLDMAKAKAAKSLNVDY